MPGNESNVNYNNAVRVEPTTLQEAVVAQKGNSISVLNSNGSPEGVLPANVGSVCGDRSTGNVYKKATGTGDTGWELLGGGGSQTSGNLVLIEEIVASGDASIEFTSDVTGYSQYKLVYENVACDTDAQNLIIQYSTDGGSNYSTSDYMGTQWFGVFGGGGLTNIGTTSIPLAISVSNGNAALPITGYQDLNYISDNINYSIIDGMCNCLNAGGHIMQRCMGYWQQTDIVDALKISFSLGNIATGTFKLYGVVD